MSVNPSVSSPKELLVLTVELGDKNVKYLKIFSNSKPRELAYEFCLENQLDYESMQNLAKEIQNVLDISRQTQSLGIAPIKENAEVEEEGEKSAEKSKKMTVEEENPELGKDLPLQCGKEVKINKPDLEELKRSIERNCENLKEKVEVNPVLAPTSQNASNIPEPSEIPLGSQTAPEISEGKQEPKKEQKTNQTNPRLETEASQKTTEIVQQSYLAPTITQLNKKREFAKPRPKSPGFVTSIKKGKEDVLREKEVEVVKANNERYLKNYYTEETSNLNPGERLFVKGVKNQEENLSKTVQRVEQENKMKEKENTYNPRINNYHLKALTKRLKNNLECDNDNKVLHYAEYSKQMSAKNQKKFLKDTDKELTFNPKINKSSRQLDKTQPQKEDVKRYEKLYNTKSNIEKLEKKIYDKDKMFKPEINKNYKGFPTQNDKEKGKENTNDINKANNITDSTASKEFSKLPFDQRQKVYKEKIASLKNERKQKEEADVDRKTGQKLFVPKINKGKCKRSEGENKKNKDKSKENVYANLYGDAKKYSEKLEKLKEAVLEKEKVKNEFKTSGNSEDIFERKKNNAYKKLFKVLDSDHDGEISKNKIGSVIVGNATLTKIFKDIIEAVVEEAEPMNEESFLSLCDECYESLDYVGKKELFAYGKNFRTKEDDPKEFLKARHEQNEEGEGDEDEGK